MYCTPMGGSHLLLHNLYYKKNKTPFFNMCITINDFEFESMVIMPLSLVSVSSIRPTLVLLTIVIVTKAFTKAFVRLRPLHPDIRVRMFMSSMKIPLEKKNTSHGETVFLTFLILLQPVSKVIYAFNRIRDSIIHNIRFSFCRKNTLI